MTKNKSNGFACVQKVTCWLKVVDHTMNSPICPSFPIGTLIGVNTEQKELINNKFYVVKMFGDLRFRKVTTIKGKTYLDVINPQFTKQYRQRITKQDINIGYLEVIGQVVAYQLTELYPDEAMEATE